MAFNNLLIFQGKINYTASIVKCKFKQAQYIFTLPSIGCLA